MQIIEVNYKIYLHKCFDVYSVTTCAVLRRVQCFGNEVGLAAFEWLDIIDPDYRHSTCLNEYPRIDALKKDRWRIYEIIGEDLYDKTPSIEATKNYTIYDDSGC